MAAPRSQWIACSPMRSGNVACRSTRSLDGIEMALSEFEQKRCEKIVDTFVDSRQPTADGRPRTLGKRISNCWAERRDF